MFTAAMIAPLPADAREFLAVMGLADEFTLEMAYFITETPHTEKLLTTPTVAAPRRLTGISVSGVSSTAAKNTTFDLTKAVVKTVDQFGKEFNSDELAAYPASIRWTLEKNDTNAVIDGNTLSFGDKDGKMTLICAAVNADTNVIVDKRIDIQIGGSSSNVTVKTTFIMDKSKDEVPNPFEDVSANSYYYDAVQWAVKNGTTGGTSATTFSPDAPCTRAQIVTFLYRTLHK